MYKPFKAQCAERSEAYRAAAFRGVTLRDHAAQSAMVRAARREARTRREALRFGVACAAVTALALLGLVGVAVFG